MGIIKDWRPLNEVPDATYYTTIGDDRFTTIHWDLKEALSAVSDAFAAFHDGEIEDVCDIELGILVPIARGEDGPEGPTLAHEATSLTTTAHARIVELETEQGELHRELARLRRQLATAREDASEMEKKAIAEGSEALALRAEVDRLKSSINAMLLNALDTPVPWDEVALRARIGSLELDTQWRQAYELQGPDREIVLYHSRLAGPTIVKWQGCGCSTLDGKWLSLGDLEDLRAVWMHIPALPESSN